MKTADLTIALSKGTLLQPTLKLLAGVGLPTADIEADSRQMVFSYELSSGAQIKYIMCRPTDVPVYVEHGAADLGVVGKDVIVEEKRDVFELLDLGFGYCRCVIAVPQALSDLRLEDLNYKRIATKFPHIAENFFCQQGMQVDLIKLHGNVELAPMMGLSDVIVDLVSTGRTLHENHLQELLVILESTTRLICNPVSYRIKYRAVQTFIDLINQQLEGEKIL